MKNKILKGMVCGYAVLFMFACASAGCPDITENVNRRNATVIVADSNGQAIDMIQSDSNGNVTHPCGTTVGRVL